MNAEWPLVLLTTVLFKEQDGKTTIELNWVPHSASARETKVFAEGMGSMNQGWGGTFDQLEVYLNTN